MEQPRRGMSKHHSVLVRSLDTLCIHNTPTRRRQILNSTPPRAMYVIREREERITRTSNSIQRLQMLLPLRITQRVYTALKHTLPLCLLASFENFTCDEQVDGIGFFCTLDAFLKGKSEDARVVTEPPEVGFGSCETGAVNTGLLACTDTDDGSAISVCDTVGLGVFECESGDDEVGQSLRRQLLIVGVYV